MVDGPLGYQNTQLQDSSSSHVAIVNFEDLICYSDVTIFLLRIDSPLC